MKISFSTLGCPDWTWEEIISAAKDLSYDGIEIRGIKNELHVPKIKQLMPQNIENTKNQLIKLGLSIPCLVSACYFHKNDRDYVEDAREYIDTASALGCPYVRVLGDTDPQPSENVDEQRVYEKLCEAARYAETKGVTLLMETNGIYADTSKLLKLVEKTESQAVAILWDIHHPYRYFGEKPEETYSRVKPYLKHVHLKDSIVENGKVVYKMCGNGDAPIKEVLNLLKNDSYSGFISLEWVKRWVTDLEAAGIVFSQFIDYVKSVI